MRRLIAITALLAVFTGCSPQVPIPDEAPPTPEPVTREQVRQQAVEAMAELPEERRPAMEKYLDQSGLLEPSTRDIAFTPLSISWKAMGQDPPVKERLVEIAESRGHELEDLVWFQFVDFDIRGPESEKAQLLHFEADRDRWVLVASRSGAHPAPVVEAR